jgi:hypothetical protein
VPVLHRKSRLPGCYGERPVRIDRIIGVVPEAGDVDRRYRDGMAPAGRSAFTGGETRELADEFDLTVGGVRWAFTYENAQRAA